MTQGGGRTGRLESLDSAYRSVDRRGVGPVAAAITRSLRAKHEIATSEGLVGVREVRDAKATLRLGVDSILLDLGSGSAEPSRTIAADTACSLVAVDSSAERLARIPQTASVSAVRADLARLPFRIGSFDAAVQFDSIVHVRDRFAHLRRVFDLLRPGSGLMITSSTNGPLHAAEAVALGDVPGTIWRMGTDELLDAVQVAGFIVDDVRTRREAVGVWHRDRADLLGEMRNELLEEMNRVDYDRMLSRARSVAELLDAGRLDMVVVRAHRP